jgi:RNA polymerase sigma factor (TIGR02999 family)
VECPSETSPAVDRLFQFLYVELRRLADRCLSHERPGHTLQRTALVHEAYLRLRRDCPPDVRDRTHFLSLAARVMRQILVDHARRRNVGKRSAIRVSLDGQVSGPTTERPILMAQLDDALSELEKRDERKAQLIELRFFGGLTAEESASVLRMEVRDVRRDLHLAQAWLARELTRPAQFPSHQQHEP